MKSCLSITKESIYIQHKHKVLIFSVTANKAKVYYGLLKEPDINIPLEEEEEPTEGDEKPKVGYKKKDMLEKL